MPTQRRREKNLLITGVAGFTHETSGQVFNIGGGLANTTSLLELMNAIGELHGHAPEIRFVDWRTADQQPYVSDTRSAPRAPHVAPF